MTIKLHGSAMSTCTGRVLITLFEKEVEDYELVEVDLSKGEHKSPEFLKHQPFGQIPYLVHGDLELFESRAIARGVADWYAKQGTPLYGSTAHERAQVEQWLEVEAQNYNPSISSIVFQIVFAPMFGKSTDEAVVAAETAKLESVLDIYEKRLSEKKYLAGDFFSLADLSHITYSYYLIKLAGKGAIYDSRPHVKAWIEGLFARPATQKWLKLAGYAQ
ncbi:hypothetical protein R1sor_000921 [Riccia sorocarpa]|uniref:glutathione transferase n=1 Tax=Riccia sorocarpa TaxID=122646 RepID=A0ABD3GYH2_9MARC